MRRIMAAGLACALILGSTSAWSQESEGLGERLGAQLDEKLRGLREELRQSWEEIRDGVEKLGVQGRVYSRLRWDKALNKASLNIDVREQGVVLLTGTVPNAAAHRKAVQLAQDTVGVTEVVDELTVSTPTSSRE